VKKGLLNELQIFKFILQNTNFHLRQRWISYILQWCNRHF